MKHLLFILFLALCATASAQTIRTLGYNSTNGQVVAATNVVWTNAFSFSTNAVAAQVRTNLGLGQTDNVQFNEISGQSITLYGGAGIVFDDSEAPAVTRTNLGLPLAVLTNTNNANFISALGVLATNGNAAGLTNFPTVATASNVTGVVALTNGGSGASNAQTARSNFFGHGGISTNISVVGTNNTNTLVFTNGLLMEVQ